MMQRAREKEGRRRMKRAREGESGGIQGNKRARDRERWRKKAIERAGERGEERDKSACVREKEKGDEKITIEKECG